MHCRALILNIFEEKKAKWAELVIKWGLGTEERPAVKNPDKFKIFMI